MLGRLPGESANNIWAHSLLAQVLNKKAFELGKDLTKSSFHRMSHATKKIDDTEIEFKCILPLLQKQNEVIQNNLTKICDQARQKGYRTELNYEIFKAVEGILKKIDKLQPNQVRDTLFVFLEKFTTNLYMNEDGQQDSHRFSYISSNSQIKTRRTIETNEQEDENYDLDQHLPQVYEPYLPPLGPNDKKYTLVLDLDETLIHYFDFESCPVNDDRQHTHEDEYGGHFLTRPGARDFLMNMSKYYELVIFTAAM